MTEAPPSTRFLFVEAFPEALRDDCSADLFVLCLNIFSGSQRCDPGDGKIRARWARAKKEADANGAGSCRRQWRRNWGVRPRGQRRILTAITATKNSATLVVTEAKNSVVSHSLRALQAWRVGEVSALTAARWRVSVVRLCLVFVRSLALPPCPANPPGAVDVVFVPRALQGIMTTTTARGTPRPATPGTVIIATTVPNLVFVRSLALPPSPAIPRGLLTAFSSPALAGHHEQHHHHHHRMPRQPYRKTRLPLTCCANALRAFQNNVRPQPKDKRALGLGSKVSCVEWLIRRQLRKKLLT